MQLIPDMACCMFMSKVSYNSENKQTKKAWFCLDIKKFMNWELLRQTGNVFSYISSVHARKKEICSRFKKTGFIPLQWPEYLHPFIGILVYLDSDFLFQDVIKCAIIILKYILYHISLLKWRAFFHLEISGHGNFKDDTKTRRTFQNKPWKIDYTSYSKLKPSW